MIKAFLCGVSKYRGNAELGFCKNDSIELAKALTQNLFIENENITYATETGEIENLDYYKKLMKFCNDSYSDDMLIIYFSGHGSIDDNGDNLLCATNTLNDDTGIYIDQMINIISKSNAKRILVILDCCHADNKNGTLKKQMDIDKAINDFYEVGVTMFSSCKSTETSNPYVDGSKSAFTQFFCDALKDKHLERDGYLYFNDLVLLVEVYARVWARKYPDLVQTPVIRSNMIGTLTFQVRYPKKITVKETFKIISESHFDIVDLKFDVKSPKNELEQKVYTATIMLKIELNEKYIKNVFDEIITRIRCIKLPATNWKQERVILHPIEVILLHIANDMIDVENSIYIYRVVWDSTRSKYWLNSLGKDTITYESLGYKANPNYAFIKRNQIENTFTDEELYEFWDKHITKIAIETEEFLNKYREYKIGEISLEELKNNAKIIIKRVIPFYFRINDVPFALPNSEIKNLDKISECLSSSSNSLLLQYSIENDRDESNQKECFELELQNYYEYFHKWSQIKKDLD